MQVIGEQLTYTLCAWASHQLRCPFSSTFEWVAANSSAAEGLLFNIFAYEYKTVIQAS